MNKVILMGRLTKDSEVRYTDGENRMAVAKNSIAVDRRGKKDEADFISIVAFGKTAEFLEKYGKKGTKFLLCGHIQTGSYTNKDGQKVYTEDVIVDEIEFSESKASATATAPQQTPPSTDADGFMNVPEDDEIELPFGRI